MLLIICYSFKAVLLGTGRWTQCSLKVPSDLKYSIILIKKCTKVKELFQISQLMLLFVTPCSFSHHLLHPYHTFPTRSPKSNPQQGINGIL